VVTPLDRSIAAGSHKYDRDGLFVHRYDNCLGSASCSGKLVALKRAAPREVAYVWTFVSNHFEGFAPGNLSAAPQRLGFELPLPSEAETALSEQDRSQLDLFRSDEADDEYRRNAELRMTKGIGRACSNFVIRHCFVIRSLVLRHYFLIRHSILTAPK